MDHKVIPIASPTDPRKLHTWKPVPKEFRYTAVPWDRIEDVWIRDGVLGVIVLEGRPPDSASDEAP